MWCGEELRRADRRGFFQPSTLALAPAVGSRGNSMLGLGAEVRSQGRVGACGGGLADLGGAGPLNLESTLPSS